jgi:hypothetical membrane protein
MKHKGKLNRLAGMMLIGAAVVFKAGEAIAAKAWSDPKYSYRKNYISDLGVDKKITWQGREIDSPKAGVLNRAVILSGMLLAGSVALLVCTGHEPKGSGVKKAAVLGLAGVQVLGCAAVGLVDETEGIIHGIGAAGAIGGGNLATAAVSRWVLQKHWGKSGRRLARLGLLGACVRPTPTVIQVLGWEEKIGIGTLQRIAVYSITAWELIVGLKLLVGQKS